MKPPATFQTEPISVSVVVPCRNEIRSIREFLDSVLHQDVAGLNLEVLIADGMSDDGTRQVLDQYRRTFPVLRVLDNPEKFVSYGLNSAIREAMGEVIVRMDAHSEYAPDYIRNCVRILNETNAANVGGPALTRADGYLARAIAIGFHSRFACGGARFRDPLYEGYVDTVPYGCWRKSTLEGLGLFDETLVRSQDDELNLRIAASGGKIWQSPKIKSWYRPRATLSSLFHQYFQYGFWKVSVIRKHRKLASWRNLVPGVSLLAAIGLLIGAAIASHGGLGRLRKAFLFDWALLASVYLATSMFISFLSARKHGWNFLPILPIIFATYHFSYGLGSLLGFSCCSPARLRPASVNKAVMLITR